MKLSLPRRRLLTLMLIAAVLFPLVSGIGRVLRLSFFGPESLAAKMVNLFDVTREHNFPSYYSALIILICAATLGLIARLEYARRAPDARYWLILALVFCYLSVDEAIELHNHLGIFTAQLFGRSGVLYFGWVVPAAVLVLLLVGYLMRFLLRLPASTVRLFVLAGGLYVSGAIGFEMMASYILSNPEQFPNADMATTLPSHVEEFLEMTGMAIYLFALLGYIHAEHGELHLRLSMSSSER